MSKDAVVYSVGLGQDISWDKALIEKYRCEVYGFDPTPKVCHRHRHRHRQSTARLCLVQ